MADNSGKTVGAGMFVLGLILMFVPGAQPIGINLMIGGALTFAGAAMAPRPSTSKDIGGTTYGSQAVSVAAEGEPKKIVLGEMQIYPEILSIKTTSDGSTETVHVLTHGGNGGEYGVDSFSDPKINGNTLDHYGDAVEVSYRYGTSDQTVMTGFEDTSVSYAVAENLPSTAWTYETKGPVDEIAIVLVWYGGLAKISSSGLEEIWWLADVDYKDDKSSNWVRTLPPDGMSDGWGNSRTTGWPKKTTREGWFCYGRTTNTYRRVMRISFPTSKKRTIRINTVQAWTTENYRRQATVSRVEEVTNDGHAYPGESLIGWKYIANEQLSGGLPKFSVVAKGWKVKNLGDTEPAWTNNPAKLLLALMTNEEMGTGRYFPLSMFDDGAGGSWRDAESHYNDQVVAKRSKGRVRLEDRTHLDLVIDSMANADEWVQHILDLTRSNLIDWGEDGIRLVVDKSSSSVVTFDGRQTRDPANRPILALPDGRIDLVEHEIETDKRTTHLTGIYWDEDDDYARRFTDEIVDPDYVDGDPRVTSELFMPGVTRESQALRQARYRVNVDRLRPLIYEMGVGIGDLDLLPMDVITVYADSPALDGVDMIVVGTTYDQDPTRGRIVATIYDADVYDDTTETLQQKAPSLTRAKALKAAAVVPAGVTNVKLTEVVGSSHLQVQWDLSTDANRRYFRVYLSSSSEFKGELKAEVEPSATGYLIRNVTEGMWLVRVLSVGRGGTEENWTTSGGSSQILITRQKVKPGAHANVAAMNVQGTVGKVVAVDPPAAGEPPQTVEVIKGPDEDRGQLVGTYTQESTGTTGEQGQRTQSVHLATLPGRRTGGGSESVAVRAVTTGGKASGAVTTVSVPFLDMPNHTPTVLSSIVGDVLVGYDVAVDTDPWEIDAAEGVRLKAIPASEDITSANGWGTSGSGLYADNPSGARYLVAGTITSQEIDLGAVKTFVLECYDEAQRDAENVFAAIESRRLNDFVTSPADWIPPESQIDESVDGSPIWAFRLLKSDGKALRPLPPTFWEYRIGDTSPLSGDWHPVAIGAMVRGRYVETRFTLADPLGMHQISSPRVYARAWVPIGEPSVVSVAGNYTVADLDSVVLVSATATITLPDAALHEGRTINVKSTNDGAVVAVTSVAGDIDSLSDQVVGGLEYISIISDGTDWWVAG